MTQDDIEPRTARDALEFVALMRRLKERSGCTLRQLEERATARGDVLARSTTADVLRRAALPRPELLGAFVRACGAEDQVAHWELARERLATERPPPPVEEPEPSARTAGRRDRSPVVLLVVVLIAAAFATSASLSTGESPDDCAVALSNGDRGQCVVAVQQQLHQAGFTMPVDGVFGPYTKMRTVAFQVLADLPMTGVVDQRTRGALSQGGNEVRTWSPAQVEDRVRATFVEDPEHAIRLVRCLSRSDPLWIFGKAPGIREWGLFQLTDAEVLFDFRVDYTTALDPDWNIRAARTLWQRQGFSRWTCPPEPSGAR